MTTRTLDVQGMTCGHCKAAVESELGKIPGVSANADVESGRVEVTCKDETVPEERLREAVAEAGYRVA